MRRYTLLLAALALSSAHVLTPSQVTISLNKPIIATSTCGEINGMPINEVYCSLASSMQYSPHNAYSYFDNQQAQANHLLEMRAPRESKIIGGHGCSNCMAGGKDAHPPHFMVDGNTSWWQSPPLSRGMKYNQVNITIDLEQEFHVAYVWIQMANSPKPGTWVLERSQDYGKSFQPWMYFAPTEADCVRRFGPSTIGPIDEDEKIMCRYDMASIQPLENAEMVINLLEHRPSRQSFATSQVLQNFTRATNVRLRLLGVRTLQGHLMDLNEQHNPSVTRRYFYAIKEIHIGGRCVCNGHASTCDVLDSARPNSLLCRCEHNTCGDMCEQCCPGFVQKKWQAVTASNNFTCEPCNCFQRSEQCEYDAEVDKQQLSLDVHGNYAGGGKCLNCREHTEGINCNKCVRGYFRPDGVSWTDRRPCTPCRCDPSKHSDICAEGSGKCECQPRFIGENCDQCAPGYYDPPECKKCECTVNGTKDEICRPINGQCPCKDGFGGAFCETCAPGFTNITAGCIDCTCNEIGASHSNCSAETGQCACRAEYSGLACDECAQGYYGFPNCTYCNCDPSGTEDGMCDPSSGQCLCKPGYAGSRCDQCDTAFYGYPACKPCSCDGAGAKGAECDVKTGDCPCMANFTGRVCDVCAAGFYDYPDCKACSCLTEGAKGQTCDDKGQCYCKGNYEGDRCDKCKPNFYNFPICEECNCHPSGVTLNFAGCDKVAPGELCSCRKHVTGRICDQCKPTFWDLQYRHPEGCIGCECHLPGTLSMLNSCDDKSGQCVCKRHVGGRQCNRCAAGYYNMRAHNQLGCEPCNCDLGGSMRSECDPISGQCKCRPRITGLKCDKPIENHFYPTLWHHQYEAEDGRTEENRPVRFASDAAQFANFSWRGYAVFSPIQEKILLDVDITKSSMYKVLLRYHNPTAVPINAIFAAAPLRHNTNDLEQSEKVTFPPTKEPAFIEATQPGKPFLLNPGRWALSLKTQQRLFLDFVVMLPQEYYEGTILRERLPDPCQVFNQHNTTCLDLLYPPLDNSAIRLDVANSMPFKEVFENGEERLLEKMPAEILPSKIIGEAAHVKKADKGRSIQATFDIPEDDEYVVLVEYHNAKESNFPLQFEITQEGATKLDGTALIQHCPYSVFCRELVTAEGRIPEVKLKKGEAKLSFTTATDAEFGLASVSLIPKAKWTPSLLHQHPVCIRRQGKCAAQVYPPAQNSVTTEAEEGQNADRAIQGSDLPFAVSDAENAKVLPLDQGEQIEISGVVPQRGHYRFIVNYFNPDNAPLDADVLVQNNDQLYQGIIPLDFCPADAGCRALIYDKSRGSQINQFWMEDKYTFIFSINNTAKSVYIDSVTAVPYADYNADLMKLQPLDQSTEFVNACSDTIFRKDNVSDFCRSKIFTITTDFNQAALSCDCLAAGSLSFNCEPYGGQCQCKPNVIGRRCDRCAPGHYAYPDCLKCKCSKNQQCNEQTGQCFCPKHVEGQTCDRCVSYAYGYDLLIGCQLCGCNQQGSENGQSACDAENGQCLCKQDVGGRRCDKCLAGFYRFPHCAKCQCESAGTTEGICDAESSRCLCKENVYGRRCEACKPGSFNLDASNIRGCTECFCFGVTEQCQSSNFGVAQLAMNISAYSVDDKNGTLSVMKGNFLQYKPSKELGAPEDVYFDIPIPKNTDYTYSYGLKLNFKMAVQPAESGIAMSSEPDIKLIGGNLSAFHWAFEQPENPSLSFALEVRLLPENFLSTDNKPLSRSDFMMLLYRLEKILVKGSYYKHPAAIDLLEFGLGVSNELYDQGLRVKATSVEKCHCPRPYKGASCQECNDGYYRVLTGPFLGSCVPCECNGHSGTCDPNTGICFDCEHNTHGDHCELCNEGFYGNATDPSVYACVSCSCPTATNNVAKSCVASEFGQMLSCSCPPGYSGETCDRCDAGHYGEPLIEEGLCEKCDCNGNNNLTDPRSCHPITGDCYLCERHTTGRRCEWCEPWYFGDAVAAKNCAECACDRCGAHNCDNANGLCTCKQNVAGDRCDRCAPDHWGFGSCQGCRNCHCGLASSSTQCEDSSGQCACLPGAAGLRCEHCANGFWNYGPNGCQKCDCEADLSMGTVCDVRTGQCHCQEGATGPRCDQCLPSYLRIPIHGCRRCDECVHSLSADVDNLGVSIFGLDHTIGNISAATLAGARLSRSNKALVNIQEIAKQINDFELQDQSGLLGRGRAVTSNVTALQTAAKQTAQQLEDNAARGQNLTTSADEFLTDVRGRTEIARHVVESMKELVRSLGSGAAALEVKPEWLTEAQQTLDTLMNFNDKKPEKLDTVQNRLEALQNNIAVFGDKNSAEKLRLATIAKNTTDVENYVKAAEDELLSTSKDIRKAAQNVKDLSLFRFESLVSGIVADAEKAAEGRRKCDNISEETTAALNSLKQFNQSIGESFEKLNASRQSLEGLKDEVNPARVRRDADADVRKKAIAHSQTLQRTAHKLDGKFEFSRKSSHYAVEAAGVHDKIAGAIQNASTIAKNITEFAGQTDFADLNTQIKTTVQNAQELNADSASYRKKEQESFRKDVSKVKSKTESVADTVAQLKRRNDAAKETIAKPVYKKEQLQEVEEKVENLADRHSKLMDAAQDIRANLAANAEAAEQAAMDNAKAMQSVKLAKSNLGKLKTLIPDLSAQTNKIIETRANISNRAELIIEKMKKLKEQISVIRDSANRIKLGAHFERGSSLDLNLPQRVTRSAAYTDISFFFRTKESYGIPIFFGNEEGSAGTRAVPTDDYIAMEIVHGRPKVSVNLGNGPTDITMDTEVTDNKWRRFLISRIGKAITATLFEPDSENFHERLSATVKGNKSVLNLHQKISKLFVGGIPRTSRIARSIHARDFVGDVDNLQFHGIPVGLWNAKPGGVVNVIGAERRRKAEDVDHSVQSISLDSVDGKGYVIYRMGNWDPRTTTNLRFSFLTFSPEGMLFFMGLERDFLSIELRDGAIKLGIDLGTGPAAFTSKGDKYNDGKWHNVALSRSEKSVSLEVDGKNVIQGESPGDMTELSISEFFYLGGVPEGINVRSSVDTLKGCIRNVQLDSYIINLQSAYASKGVRNACTANVVREVSILSERSVATFEDFYLTDEIEITLRFKTSETRGSLFSIAAEDDIVLASLQFENGFLKMSANGKERTDIELSSLADGQWHFVSVRRDKDVLRIDVDDLFGNQTARISGESEVAGEKGKIVFGKQPSGSFVGCIGDITYNGRLLDFALATSSEVQLTGCPLPDQVFLPTPGTLSTLAPSKEVVHIEHNKEEEEHTTTRPITTTAAPESPLRVLRSEKSCMLSKLPLGERPDSEGLRYGTQPNSRLEYEITPDPFDKSGTFSFQLRTTTSNGVILFASDNKDHIGVYLHKGRIHFIFNTGSGQISISSNTSVLDDEWHTVKAYRNGNGGTLSVDEELIEVPSTNLDATGSESVDTVAPLYFGGVRTQLTNFIRKIIPHIRTEFSGCLRDLKLNDKKFDAPPKEINVVKCSEFTENGMFFGSTGGYAVISKDFEVGNAFVAELEVRPRVNSAVLFSVGVLQYVSLEVIDGKVRFAVDSGAGIESINMSPPTNVTLCDGHWHSIKVHKKKHLITITVDGRSQMLVLKKKGKAESFTHDPVYVGGVPEGASNPGLKTSANYIGCMRIVHFGHKKDKTRVRMRKQIPLADVEVFGDVQKSDCPVN